MTLYIFVVLSETVCRAFHPDRSHTFQSISFQDVMSPTSRLITLSYVVPCSFILIFATIAKI